MHPHSLFSKWIFNTSYGEKGSKFSYISVVELNDTGAILKKAKWACDELSLLKNS